MTQAVSDAVEFDRNDVVQMFYELGNTSAAKWAEDDKKLLNQINKLPKMVLEDKNLKPDSEGANAVFQEILEALDNEAEITFTGEVKPPEDDEDEEEEKPKKRGRKPSANGKAPKAKKAKKAKAPKAKKAKKVKEKEPEPEAYEEPVSYGWERKEPTKVNKATPALVEEWRTLPRLPRDREVQPARIAYLKAELEAGRFRGAEWAKVYVEETKTTYGINGKHTSIVLEDAVKAGKKLDCSMTISSWQCKTMEDAAALYRTYDAKESVKTKQDDIKCMAGTNENTKDIPAKTLNLITAGIAFAKWEKGYRRHKTLEQGKLMLKNSEFAAWCAELLKADGEEKKKTSHISRVAVIAAIYKTWLADKEAAAEFWIAIRDACDDSHMAPRPQLREWLKEHTFGAPGKNKKDVVTDREGYHACLKAWNCWRPDANGNESTWEHKYSLSNKTPEAR